MKYGNPLGMKVHYVDDMGAESRIRMRSRTTFRTSMSLLLLTASLVGCSSMNLTTCSSDGRSAVQELVYFGTDTPSGSVTPEDWAQFLSEVVTPRFPDGLSTWQASGQWRSATGAIIREPSYVLNLVHPDDVGANQAVQEIVSSYKTRFQQEAVLRVRSSTCMSL